MSGPAHGQRVTLKHGGGGSTLEVIGSDVTLMLDRTVRESVWDNVTDSDVVKAILKNHAALNFTPDIQPTTTKHQNAKHTLVQRDTDLRFLQRLARRNGYLFWVTTNATGRHTAHFRRPALPPAGDRGVTINLPNPSLDELEVEWDLHRAISVSAKQLDLNTVKDIDGAVPQSPMAALGKKALGQVAPTKSLVLTAPTDTAGDLKARGEAVLIEAGWFVRARGSTSTTAVGGILRAHSAAALKGLGTRHDGRYLVTSVRHQIDASGHKMQFQLARNAWDA